MKRQWGVFCGRSSIIFLFLVGLCICFWWYPFSISLDTVGLVSGESGSTVPITREQNIAFWVQLIFMWLVSVPCYVVLGFWFKSISYIKQNRVFSNCNAVIFRKTAWILWVDAITLILGNSIFVFLKWNSFAFIYLIIGVLGMIIAVGNYAIYIYLRKAITIKEENDSIL